ncbi:MAG TPA: phosphodiesterase [Gammaproteobacteria bacterium]|nr:phosphodiesterase [Gammaproteobacteria bacterium]
MAKTIPTTLALLVLAAPCALADTLLIDGIDVDKQSVDARPKPGMSMTAVESTYGAPAQRHAAVGGAAVQQPPITRWDYPSFSVYFENDRVIHAVARK